MKLKFKPAASLVLAAVLVSLSACGGGGGDDKSAMASGGADDGGSVIDGGGVTNPGGSETDHSSIHDIAFSSFEVSLPQNLRPLTNSAYEIYAVKPSIRFSISEDNTLDTYWEGVPSVADANRHLSRISLASKGIVSDIPLPSAVNVGNTTFLGYEYLGNDRYITGVSSSNASDIERKSPTYQMFDHTGAIKYTLDLWKDTPDAHAAARSGQGLIVYNKKIDNFGIYLARRDANSHQAAWLSFHEAATGRQTFSRPWYISHNFDHRLLPLNDGRYLAAAHADSMPSRGLLLEKWSFNDSPWSRTWSNVAPFPKSATSNYNITNAATGDILELPNGEIAVLYTTQRATGVNDQPRDVRLAIFKNVGVAKQSAVKVKDVWLTNYNGAETAGWGAQMAHYSDGKIFLAWNVFDPAKPAVPTKSSMAIVDYNGTVLSSKDIVLPNATGGNSRLVQPSQTIRTTADGKNLVFLSEGSAPDKLRVNMVAITQ